MNEKKKSLGYGVFFTTAFHRPVTGREWVWTATDEQMQVLYDIEQLWETLRGTRYLYSFREVHDDDGDGWVITLHDRAKAESHWKRFWGFPSSATFVLQALQLLYKQTCEEAADV